MKCKYFSMEIYFHEIIHKWRKSKDHFIKHKCKSCGMWNPITQDITGKL